jgi:hypothetical protein
MHERGFGLVMPVIVYVKDGADVLPCHTSRFGAVVVSGARPSIP